MTDTYNSSYSGGRDLEDYGTMPAWRKKFTGPYLNHQMVMVWACHPSFTGKHRYEDQGLVQPRHEVISKITKVERT
jgi:hypothetical protein